MSKVTRAASRCRWREFSKPKLCLAVKGPFADFCRLRWGSLSKALHLTATGAVYPATHPLLRDLFSELLPTPEATLTRALELATEIATHTSSVSTNLMREMMYRNPGSAEATHLLDSAILYSIFGSKDNVEGAKSFLEKRDAVFEGVMRRDAPVVYPWWDAVGTGVRSRVKGEEFEGHKPKL